MHHRFALVVKFYLKDADLAQSGGVFSVASSQEC